MDRLIVDVGHACYPIDIGYDILSRPFTASVMLKRHTQVVVITSKEIATHYLQPLKLKLQTERVDVIEVASGEAAKSLSTFEKVVTHLLEKNYSRHTLLIALGGGTIGDLTGFVAATYQRGVSFLQIPTTLLAQVDASVGGKTALNHPLGKNMIGAFYQPQQVIIDIACLKTLPRREFNSGLAEVIKHAIIWDEAFFSWLENNLPALQAQDASALSYAIKRCCEIKTSIVQRDEREQGLRMVLNLGHTFGHAIETGLEYACLHGEAVSIGIALAARCSLLQGFLTHTDYRRIHRLLTQAKLPVVTPSRLTTQEILDLMQKDKKNHEQKLRLVLPLKLGEVCTTTQVPHELMRQVINTERAR